MTKSMARSIVLSASIVGVATSAAIDPPVRSLAGVSSDAEKTSTMELARNAIVSQAMNTWHGALFNGAESVQLAAAANAKAAVLPSRPSKRWRSTKAVRGSSLRMTSEERSSALSYCRQCLCDAGITSHLKCNDNNTNQVSHLSQCLEDMPCCDCQSCRQGWKQEEYPQGGQVGMQCEAACTRCEHDIKYTKQDLKVLHPPPSTVELWNQALAKNSAATWAQNTCAKRTSKLAGARLDAHIDGELACLAAELGQTRMQFCACEQGDQSSCALKNKALFTKEFLTLAKAAPASHRAGAGAESLLAGSPKGWFCVGGPAAFGSMGAKLFASDLDTDLVNVVPSMVEEWASAWMGMLGRVSLDNANRQVAGLKAEEVEELATKVLEKKTDSLKKLEEKLWDDEDAEKLQLLEQTALFAGVSKECVIAQHECSANAACKEVVTKLAAVEAIPELITETFRLCDQKSSLFAVLRVSAECPGRLPMSALKDARSELEGVQDMELCARTTQVKQDFIKQVLPHVLQSITDEDIKEKHTASLKALPKKCVAAHQMCGSKPRCGPAIEAMERQRNSTDAMLAEAEKLCDDKQAMLFAFDVSSECGGLLPEREARMCREVTADEPEEKLCLQMDKMTAVLNVLMEPEIDADCEAALRECTADDRCKGARESAAAVGGDPEAMISETLKLCDDKDALLTSLRTTAECRERLPEWDVRRAYAHLEPVSNQDLCKETEKVGVQLRAKVASITNQVPPACAQAHRSCGASARCRATRVAAASLGGSSAKDALEEALGLCDDQGAMLAALGVAAECPAGLSQKPMRSLRQALSDVPQAELCMEALKFAPLLDPSPAVLNSTSLLSPSALQKAEGFAVEAELPAFAWRVAKVLVEGFDVSPEDNRLNAVEASALLREVQAEGRLLSPEGIESLRLAALDASKDRLVDIPEFANVLRDRLRPSLQRLVRSE